MMMRYCRMMLAGLLAAAPAMVWADEQGVEPAQATADAALPARDDAVVLETLVVSGVVPGPGMWQVRRGEHTMWILGTLRPVARRMSWESGKVERTLETAEAILLSPTVKFDLGMGRFRSLMLMPSMLGARKNPEGEKLADRVPQEDYARWLVLKKKYMGRDRGVEKMRPIFAADELYRAAVEKSGLQFKGVVSPVLDKVAKRHSIPSQRPRVEIAVSDPKGAIRAFRATVIDDAACFRKTLDHLESDLEKMRLRANAWAQGDMQTLREVTYEDQSQACMGAVFESRFAKDQGIDDLPARLEAAWLEAAEKTLAEHRVSFAVLPMRELVAADGYLAKLAARGYEVEAPSDVP